MRRRSVGGDVEAGADGGVEGGTGVVDAVELVEVVSLSTPAAQLVSWLLPRNTCRPINNTGNQ